MLTACVVGATGFTGAVLTDLLARHPLVRLGALTSNSYAGREVAEVFAHLRVAGAYVKYEPAEVLGADVAFVCYPHAEAHRVVLQLLDLGLRVIDLSADFRLRRADLYPEWYGFEHPRPGLLDEAVYGLTELNREAVRGTRLVANPGCFPTGALLALAPLAGRIPLDLVVVDSASGVSGAGRTPTEKTHFTSVQDNFRAYGEVGHRHTAEMAQELTRMAGRPVALSFTPHLLPVERGILSTVYLRPAPGSDVLEDDELHSLYTEFYRDEPFVEVARATPSLREVQGTNYCRLAVRSDRSAGVMKVFVAIDNLVKGASGQALQNMNVMFGLPETVGLEGRA